MAPARRTAAQRDDRRRPPADLNPQRPSPRLSPSLLRAKCRRPCPDLDSKSAIDLTFDAVAFKKTKHVLRDAHFLRDVVARLLFAPKHVASADMLADCLTKPLPRPLFVRIRTLLHLVEAQIVTRASRRG